MTRRIFAFLVITALLGGCGPKAEKKPQATALDQAFDAAKQDPAQRENYYRTFLNADILVPTTDLAALTGENAAGEKKTFAPVILPAADGKQFLMIFDTEERLAAWAKRKIGFVTFKGSKLAEAMDPQYHWVLNWGTSYRRQFTPDDIRWLKQADPQKAG